MATKNKHKARSSRSHRKSESGFNTLVRSSVSNQLRFYKRDNGGKKNDK